MITQNIVNYSKNPITKEVKSIFNFFNFLSPKEETSFTITRRRKRKERKVISSAVHNDAQIEQK